MTLVIALIKPAGQVITDTLSDVNSGVLGMLAYQSASGVPPNNNVSVKSEFKEIKAR